MRSVRAAALAAAFACAAPVAHAGAGPGITVYTWTDAAGVTHFSDKPRARGPAQTLHLPTPPPADQTAIAANRAWLQQMDREWQASQERAEERRREAARAGEYAQYAPQPQAESYVPLYLPLPRYRGRHHRHHGGDYDRHGRMPPRFPQQALPSSFPDPLASSFPGLPASSFPEARGGPLAPPHG